MSHLIIVIQEKGGVGKTFLATHLTAYLRQQKYDIRPVDFDVEEGLITRIFPPPDSASLSPNPQLIEEGTSKLPHLMERAINGQRWLIDCGANTGPAWHALFTKAWPTLLDTLHEKGVKITLIIPVDSSEKARKKFVDYKVEFPGAQRILVVYRRYKDHVFPLPEHPPELTFDMPLVNPKLFDCYVEKQKTIDQLASSTDKDLTFVRGFATGYLPQLTAAFDRIKPILLQ